MKRFLVFSLLLCVMALFTTTVVAWAQIPSAPEKLIDIEFKDMPVSEALDALFKASGKSYSVDPGISPLKITAVLKNVPFDVALKQVVKTAGLVYRVDNGIYMISAHQTPSATAQPGMPTPCATSASGTRSEVVNLQYLTAGELASILAKSGKLSVTSTSNNKLVLTGSAQDISEALALIQALDVGPKMVKPVRLTLKLKIKIEKLGKATRVIEPTVQNVGPEGIPIVLQLSKIASYTNSVSTVVKEKVIKQEVTQFLNCLLQAVLTPVLSDNGLMTITGKGQVSWPLEPGKPDQVSSGFDVATTGEENKPITIASGEVNITDGKARYEILLTAKTEPGLVPAVSQTPPQDQGLGIMGGEMQSNYGQRPAGYNPGGQSSPRSW